MEIAMMKIFNNCISDRLNNNNLPKMKVPASSNNVLFIQELLGKILV